MPVLHGREGGSGFYIRARVAGNWITWQVTVEGEYWLAEGGFHDGEAIDFELVDMLRDKGWLYTAGSGPGVALESGQPSFLRTGEGVNHAAFGIGEIREVLQGGRCRVVFFREYPTNREVPAGELSAARSIDLARERSAAYSRALRAKEATGTRTALQTHAAPPAEPAGTAYAPAQASAKTGSSSGCFATLVGAGVLMSLTLSTLVLMVAEGVAGRCG